MSAFLVFDFELLTRGRLTNGSAVRLTGNLLKSPGRGQEWEFVVQEGSKGAIEILGDCDVDVCHLVMTLERFLTVLRHILFKRKPSRRSTFVIMLTSVLGQVTLLRCYVQGTKSGELCSAYLI